MPDVSLHLFDCGSLTLPHHWIFLKGEHRPYTIPLQAYLIRHPDGDVLIDGGMPLAACRDPRGHMGDLYEVMQPEVSADRHIVAQLEGIGVDPAAIRYAVTTHLHFDHVGAVGELPNAAFLVHHREVEYARDPDWFADAYNREAWDRPDVDWRPIALDDEWPELDLFHDGAVRIVFAPGRAVGLLAVVVKLASGTVILAGDVADTRAHYDHEYMPGLYVDGSAVVRSIDRLRAIEAATDAQLVIFGHDPDQWPTLKKGADAYR